MGSGSNSNSLVGILIDDGIKLLIVLSFLFTSCNENTTPFVITKEMLRKTAGDSTSTGVIYGRLDKKLPYNSSAICEIGPAKFIFGYGDEISISRITTTVTAKVISPNTFVSIGPDIGRLRAHQYGDSISNKLDWRSGGQSLLMYYRSTPTHGPPQPYVPGPWDPPGDKYMIFKVYEGAAAISGWIKIGYSGGYWRMNSYGYVEN